MVGLAQLLRARVEANVPNLEDLVKVLGLEHVNPHAGQRLRFIAGHRGWIRGLFDEIKNLVGVIHGHHTKALGLFARHGNATHSDFRARADVFLDHRRRLQVRGAVTDAQLLRTVVSCRFAAQFVHA